MLNFNRLELDFYLCYDRTSYSIKRVRHSIIRFLVMLWWIILVFFWQTNTLQQYITRRSNSLSKMIKSARFIGPVQVSWVIICSWGYFYDDIMDVLSVDRCYLKDTKLGCPKNETGSCYCLLATWEKSNLEIIVNEFQCLIFDFITQSNSCISINGFFGYWYHDKICNKSLKEHFFD